MNLDIIFVTFNSSKWIDKCLDSILKSDYNLKKVNLVFFDNNSSDGTIQLLEKWNKKSKDKIKSFKIIKNKKNYGFGIGNNKAFKKGESDLVFFLNIDTEIKVDTLTKINDFFADCEENIGVLELRQEPFEHPKYYDPITNETGWFSGACFVVKRKVFKKAKGFDKHIFMYCEDVDLSFKIRKIGYKIIYDYNNSITHYSYSKANEFKLLQFANSISNNVYLRLKHGNLADLLKGILVYKNVFTTLRVPENFDLKNVKKEIKKMFMKMFFWGQIELIKRIGNIFKKNYHCKYYFNFLDYELNKNGAFYTPKEVKDKSLVSIIVRTHNRPTVLKETIQSILNQTYQNFEIIVVEDGKATAKTMLSSFKDNRIKYYSTNEKKGRCYVGNYGIKKSSGEYINFLDDDDLFYNDHIETLLSNFEVDDNIVYSTSFATEIEIISIKPYKYNIKSKTIPCNNNNINIINLCKSNQTPIQAVMFRRNVFENCGGLDETMDALEDWDLWIRFALKYKFKYVDKTTSIYRIPYDQTIAKEREQFLKDAYDSVRSKYAAENTTVILEDLYNEDDDSNVSKISFKGKIVILTKKILKKFNIE